MISVDHSQCAAFGLANIGATCYFNSLVQMLLSLTSLRTVLSREQYELIDNALVREYLKLATYLDSPAQLTAPVIPRALFNAFVASIRASNPTSTLGTSQECAEEAFTMFIDRLTCRAAEDLFSCIYEPSIVCKQCNEKIVMRRDNSLRVMMPADPAIIKTQGEFQDYIRFRYSEVTNYKCDKCGGVSSGVRRAEALKRIGECIITMFPKYTSKSVCFFPPAFSIPALTGPAHKYELVATIEHSGSASSGHYIAKALRGATWYTFNDSGVTVTSMPAPAAGTFMAAYHWSN